MKRFLSIALAMLILLMAMPMSTLAVQNAAVAESTSAQNTEPTFVADSVAGYAGDTIAVAIRLKNNPGIVSMRLDVSYDATVLELTKIAGQDYAGASFGPLNSNPISVNWVDAISPNNETNGVFAVLTFKIKDNAAEGTVSPIELSYNSYDVYDFDWNDVYFATQNGSVSVNKHVTGVALNVETLNIKNSDTATLQAIISPADAYNQNVSWTSDNPAVATVDDNGMVTGIKKGTANITVTTEDGGYTATCFVDVACAHLNVTETPREESSCIKQGHTAYTTCDDCGEIIEGANELLPLADHKGGTATCIALAICEVCGAEHGEYAPHALTHVKAIAPDHYNGGNIEYWTCDVCEGYFADDQAEQPITLDDTLLAIIPHTHSDAWSYDETQHWHECECGHRADENAHVFDNACDAVCICGFTREVPDHVYDNLRDNNCNECGHIRKATVFEFTAPATRVYTKGAALDLNGGSIEIVYDDGAAGTLELTADMVTGYDSNNTSAVQELTVACGGNTATYQVRVMEGDKLPTIVMDSAKVYKFQETFTVALRLENNPGIVSMMIDINYDTDVLELIKIEGADFAGTAFGPLNKTPIAVNWFDTLNPNNETDGTIALLTFKIKENVDECLSTISVSYDQENVYDFDFENVPFNTANGIIDIRNHIPGDLNGDGIVNNKDLGLLQRKINRWNVDIIEAAADVNADGVINNKDLGLVQRKINRWDIELK